MMTRRALVVLIASLGPGLLAQNTPSEADLVLLHGRVVTVDERFSVAAALAVREGRFIAAGSNDDVRVHIQALAVHPQGVAHAVLPIDDVEAR